MNKRLCTPTLCLLLAILLLAAPLQTFADAVYKPGDTVTATISYSGTALKATEVSYTLSSGLTFVSVTGTGMQVSGSATKAVGFSFTDVSSGTFTVTAKVKDDATGNQTIAFGSVLGAGSGDTSKKSVGAAKTETFAVEAPAVPEVWGNWVQTLAPTCTTPGSEERVSDLNNKETREVAALGHDWGAWTPVTQATCLEKGSEERVCKRDATHKETREVAALGHDWGAWTVKTPATCTAKGLEERVCKRDATHKETRDIAILAHKEGKWEVVRAATAELPGLRVIKCLVGGEILKQEEIPFNTTRTFNGNTASTQGLYFRQEMPGLTKEWNMFTPLDLSKDGQQVIPLIASNMYYIGNVRVSVAGGKVVVTSEPAPRVKVRSEFMTFFSNLAEVESIDPRELADKNIPFGTLISIAGDLKGDTKVLLYVRNVVDYAENYEGVTRFTNKMTQYTSVLDALKANMD